MNPDAQAALGRVAAAGRRGASRRAGAARARTVAPRGQRRLQRAAARLRGGHRRPGDLLGRQPAVAGVRLALPVRLRHGAAGGAAPGVQRPRGLALLRAAQGSARQAPPPRSTRAARGPARRARRLRRRRCRRRGLRAGPAQRQERTDDPDAARRGAGAGDAASGPVAPALAFVERFHALTSHSRAGVLTRAPAANWGDAPPPFKPDAGVRRVRLPPPGAARVTPLDLGALGDILWHTAGVTETRGGLHLRASPSSGALFSTELYLAVRALPGLASGLWHYDPQAHALAPLRDAAAGALPLREAVADEASADAPVLVVATAVFRRTGRKYGDRSYRFVLADLGHALENLRVTAGALGVGVRLPAAFDEARVARALQVDEAEEGVLAMIALGAPAGAAVPGAARQRRGRRPVGGLPKPPRPAPHSA
ncbi:MAG: SagB family peptide dehydrogenase [Comamonadaceae bacterium]|nr:SagB family peptide dehydrogenase [Comamonadaceae bacterium]